MASAQKNTNYVAGWLGALSVAVVVVTLIFAISQSNWHFGTNSISDLGVAKSPLIFTAGMVIAGILLVIYGAGRAASDRDLYRTGALCTAIAGVGLVMIAVFNLDMGKGYMHYLFAAITALFLALTVVINSYQLWMDGGNKRLIAGVGIIVFVVSIATLIALTHAEWQTYSVVAVIIWFVLDVAAYLGSGLNLNKKKEVA